MPVERRRGSLQTGLLLPVTRLSRAQMRVRTFSMSWQIPRRAVIDRVFWLQIYPKLGCVHMSNLDLAGGTEPSFIVPLAESGRVTHKRKKTNELAGSNHNARLCQVYSKPKKRSAGRRGKRLLLRTTAIPALSPPNRKTLTRRLADPHEFSAVRPQLTGILDDFASFLVDGTHSTHDVASGIRQIFGAIGNSL